MTTQATDSIEVLREGRNKIQAELSKVIIGQTHVVDELLTTVFCGGHCLLEGVPGLAKTLMISTLARLLHLKFKRIQFTPDLMPSDILGTDVIEEDMTTGKRSVRFIQGPIFANIILADEINRTPPKTQAALLEAMQEHKVTIGGGDYKLDEPFFVLATQNPIEQEGTYPLPEAQLDRFMFKVVITYPSKDEEQQIALRTTGMEKPSLEAAFSGEDIINLQHLVREIPISPHVAGYAVNLVRATRPKEADAADFAKQLIDWGAGPRAVQYLVLGAKAHAALLGHYNVSCEDVRAVAKPVLRHRILPSFAAEAKGINSVNIIEELVQKVPEPSEADYGKQG
jgi:MoxR-like ATPase